MSSKVSIPKWLGFISISLHVVFAICLAIWICHRYARFEATRTLFSFSELNPTDAKPASLRSCRPRALDTTLAPKSSLLVLGDSLVQFGNWSALFERPVINHGVEGDFTDCVIYRLPLTVSVAPSSIILLLGINDLISGRSPEAIAANHWRILSTLRRTLPETRVYISSLLPIADPFRSDVEVAKISEMNVWLKKLAEEFGVAYIDSFNSLADATGKLRAEYSSDGIHLTQLGYRELSAKWEKSLGGFR